MRLLRYFFTVTLIMVGVLLLMVLRDIINPPREVSIQIEPAFVIYPETQDNWGETAHALGVDPDSLTLEEFYAHDSIGSGTHKEALAQLRELVNNPQN